MVIIYSIWRSVPTSRTRLLNSSPWRGSAWPRYSVSQSQGNHNTPHTHTHGERTPAYCEQCGAERGQGGREKAGRSRAHSRMLAWFRWIPRRKSMLPFSATWRMMRRAFHLTSGACETTMSVRTTFRAGGHRRPHAVGSGAGVRWEVAWGWVLTASSIRARRASWSRCESSMLLSDSSVRVGTHSGETLELETHAAAGMACSGEHGGRVRLHVSSTTVTVNSSDSPV